MSTLCGPTTFSKIGVNEKYSVDISRSKALGRLVRMVMKVEAACKALPPSEQA
jgi:hypothetical protein